jgi:hypothetical protein
MSGSLSVETVKVLECLGFAPSRSPYNRDGLVLHFGNCELEAFQPDFSGRVAFIGSIDGTGRTIYPPLEFYLPARVISVQQCAALLSYYLRHYPIQESPMWLAEGRLKEDLLPWNIDAARRKAAYDALPKCFVRCEWLRLALKQLEATIASKSDEARIWLRYADGILSIMCDEENFVVSAKGLPWPNAIFIRAGDIRDLPKRLRGEEISIVVGDAYLQIGTKYYHRQIDENPPAAAGAVPS